VRGIVTVTAMAHSREEVEGHVGMYIIVGWRGEELSAFIIISQSRIIIREKHSLGEPEA